MVVNVYLLYCFIKEIDQMVLSKVAKKDIERL